MESMRQKLTRLVNQSEEGLCDEERTQLLGGGGGGGGCWSTMTHLHKDQGTLAVLVY